jgi:hypothetical protein
MARRRVVTAITPSAITGTGNGTLTAVSVVEGPVVPQVGNYTLTCITTVTNGGVWRLRDPNGAIVSGYLNMTVGAGTATIFEAGGLIFTLTDGSTDFVAGDVFTIPVVADGDLVPYSPTGVGGAQFPIAVMPYALTKASSGDLAGKVIVSGAVQKERLIIDADGNDDNITTAIIDQLRLTGIIAVSTTDLSVLDNQ